VIPGWQVAVGLKDLQSSASSLLTEFPDPLFFWRSVFELQVSDIEILLANSRIVVFSHHWQSSL
jgi:hypothetical protein